MIGVFDSGFGGLSVLRALAALPENLDLIYFGDNARAPYGTRPGHEVLDFTREGVEFLFDRGCRLVIVACNTASGVALRKLQQEWLPSRSGPKVNVLGIVVPTVEQIVAEPDEIAVFATLRTVETEVFPIEITKRRPEITIYQEACPGLASEIESGADDDRLLQLIREHVDALVERIGRCPRRVILGCTHYSLISHLFASALGTGVRIFDQPSAVAASLSAYLPRHPEYGIPARGHGTIQFLTSGFAPQASRVAEAFWGTPIEFESRNPKITRSR